MNWTADSTRSRTETEIDCTEALRIRIGSFRSTAPTVFLEYPSIKAHHLLVQQKSVRSLEIILCTKRMRQNCQLHKVEVLTS
ncbi:hypothetical protein ANCCAN_04927 [Ancylostoma caninum]|uniref:Uncharacterized protein n=1 Tax=Ancylostoma caninum TaxID=29170 RepID=A0A368H110_ANCCA|nr:hypothetical protein ANCCAN_04927 [Ancylostoma caninum]